MYSPWSPTCTLGVTVPFTLSGSPDRTSLHGAGRLSVSGYALPDRDYYLKPDARFKEAREKYSPRCQDVPLPAGPKPATAAAATVMALETKFAEAALDNVALRDPSATDHNTTFVQLQAMSPHFDWTAYLTNLGLAARRRHECRSAQVPAGIRPPVTTDAVG